MNSQTCNYLPTLYALHGFLGSTSDWDFFKAEHFGVNTLIPVDLFTSCHGSSLTTWAMQFINHFDPSLLMGYSLGARAALHALLLQPTRWKAAILISCHPGLRSEQERLKRIEHDQVWAEKFLSKPWNDLLEEWNHQKVLVTSRPINRHEMAYDRNTLAYVLRAWSLGLGQDLREEIARLPFPILWIYGEKDEPYNSLAHSLSFAHPLSSLECIAQSGHRVPWDQPKLFQEKVHHWLKTVL
ncbi:MAG: alpha/beta hydrolase [Chlamydiales bacterium]|nr:alpha/beta hydrolase [Chlamydiales bacterium]